MPRRKYRIIVADDHPALRESIADAVTDFHADRMEVSGMAVDGPSAVDLARKHRPDLAVLDLGMPRMDGIQVIREVKKASPDTAVLVVSMYDDQAHVVEAVRAGAEDYLFKNQARPTDIAARALELLEKRSTTQDRLHQRLFSALRGMEGRLLDLGVTRLTEAELKVLSLAAHRGLSMKEIACELGGSDVRKHFERIYDKLGAQSQAHAVCLAVKYGLIDCEAAEPVRGQE